MKPSEVLLPVTKPGATAANILQILAASVRSIEIDLSSVVNIPANNLETTAATLGHQKPRVPKIFGTLTTQRCWAALLIPSWCTGSCDSRARESMMLFKIYLDQRSIFFSNKAERTAAACGQLYFVTHSCAAERRASLLRSASLVILFIPSARVSTVGSTSSA